ncbi:FUSC family protein [Anaerobacillus sp. MEB173]|uniref:FUSC family protein n=1 Tax=Anaerobacillus sp. MEB173 TaxID=3383345 RepID=UPI003F8FDA10
MKGLIGRRIIKTGISVLLTALICLSLNLPAEFAIIAAIVTIEPTASASIKKGFVRFPASAIGAAWAVILVSWLGESVLSYTLAAFLTIFFCQKLKLHDGILVATLTAVVMVPDIEGDYLLTFLSRLGTTTIGLTVSSLINFFILPPKFTPLIKEKLYPNFRIAGEVLAETMNGILHIKQATAPVPTSKYLALRQGTEKVGEIISFQEREWKYHKVKLSEYRHFLLLKKKNAIMQRIVLHLGNLQYVAEPGYFSESEKKLIMEVIQSFQSILNDPSFTIPGRHYVLVYDLDHHLKYEANQLRNSNEYFHHFTTKRVVFFELLSIHDSIEELNHLVSGE